MRCFQVSRAKEIDLSRCFSAERAPEAIRTAVEIIRELKKNTSNGKLVCCLSNCRLINWRKGKYRFKPRWIHILMPIIENITGHAFQIAFLELKIRLYKRRVRRAVLFLVERPSWELDPRI